MIGWLDVLYTQKNEYFTISQPQNCQYIFKPCKYHICYVNICSDMENKVNYNMVYY